MTLTTTARDVQFADLRTLLEQQQEAKIDAVVPAARMRSKGGIIHLTGTEPVLTDEGVTLTDGRYEPTRVFDEGLADKLGIPLKYLRTMREQRPDLYDANVNGWLHGKSIRRGDGSTDVLAPADRRNFFFRGFRNHEDGGLGYGRALLSDSYGVMDNLDVLTAVLSGVREAGVNIEIGRCDLTDRRMYVSLNAPEVAIAAPALLAGYRSPFSGAYGADNPIVHASIKIANSEVGDGATVLTPSVVAKVCDNGMTQVFDAVRSVHVGGRMPEGVVRWSADTERKNLAVITAKARDAVASFLSTDYLRAAVARMEAEAGIEVVASKLKFTEAERAGVLDHFIKGGQLTAGGVMQAVTSYCQLVEDADSAHTLQDQGVAAMHVAATLTR